MVQHMPDIISQLGNLQQFSCQGKLCCLCELNSHLTRLCTYQGVEKLNDDTKKTFFRASNKWDPARDMLANEYKMEKLESHSRGKRTYKSVIVVCRLCSYSCSICI